MMQMLSYRPRPPLSSFVELFWLAQSRHQGVAHLKERVLPTGTLELVINLQGEHLGLFETDDLSRPLLFGSTLVVGPHARYFVIDASDPLLLGVHFQPGGAFPFFGLPTDELRDLHIDLAELWGASAASSLRDCLLEAATPQARFRILESILLERLLRSQLQHPAVVFALERFRKQPETLSIVTDEIGLSERRFRQLFRQEVGLAPKLFWRVQRFQKVLGCIQSGAEIDWVDLALLCGYFDQSHFIRDFKSFSGLSPTSYATSTILSQNHVPIID